MSRAAVAFGSALVVAAALPITALAAAPVRIWVSITYAPVPDDPHQNITYEFQLDGMDKVNALCGNQANLMRLVKHIQRIGSLLEHESILGQTCVKDSSGKIKIAADESAVEGK